MQARFSLAIILCGCIFYVGCASKAKLAFKIREPVSKDIFVTGLKDKDKIIEAFDTYKGQPAGNNNFWLVVKRRDTFGLGKIDFISGKVKIYKRLDGYDPDSSLYWTEFTEEKLGYGKRVLGRLFGGLGVTKAPTDAYTFSAQKYFDAGGKHGVIVAYDFKRTRKSNLFQKLTEASIAGSVSGDLEATVEDTNSMAYIFIRRESKYSIENFEGYQQSIYWDDNNSNAKRSRYYPVFARKGLYLGIHPGLSYKKTAFFNLFDLRSKTSWGAGLNFPAHYVDAGVTANGKVLGVILGKPGKYFLRVYSTEAFLKSLKNFE